MRKSSIGALAILAGGALASTASAQSQVYAIDLRQGTPSSLLKFPVNAPAQNVLSSTAAFDGYAMDFNSAATVLFGVTEVATGPGEFGTIDQATGNFTPIAPITGDAAAVITFTGLSIDPTDETYFLSSAASLFTLNPATGVTTLVGDFNPSAPPTNIEIAIDRNGIMYGHDIGADNLLSIDKNTGAATVIGPTGFAASFAQGMDFDYATDTLYATVYTGGGTGLFASFDLATGAGTTLVSTSTWNAEMEMAIASPIPEPASMSMLAVASGLLLRRRRPRRAM